MEDETPSSLLVKAGRAGPPHGGKPTKIVLHEQQEGQVLSVGPWFPREEGGENGPGFV